MNLAIYFLALIGLIVILIVIYRFSVISNQNAKSGVVKNWPPRQYMENVGKYCPDYWVYMGKDPNNSKKHICMNSFNVDIKTPVSSTCYSNRASKQKIFTTPSLTDNGIEKGAALNEMCQFIKNCGPETGLEASWLGINTSNGWAVCP